MDGVISLSLCYAKQESETRKSGKTGNASPASIVTDGQKWGKGQTRLYLMWSRERVKQLSDIKRKAFKVNLQLGGSLGAKMHLFKFC